MKNSENIYTLAYVLVYYYYMLTIIYYMLPYMTAIIFSKAHDMSFHTQNFRLVLIFSHNFSLVCPNKSCQA